MLGSGSSSLNGPPTPFTSLYDGDDIPMPTSAPSSSVLQPSGSSTLRRSFGPHLVILRQNSAAEEKVTKNGVPKMTHVVIKNSPFVVTIGQEVPNGSSPLDFNDYAIDCTLLYDDDAADKTVDFVKNKPVEFKASPADHGAQLHVEMRIKVLTSHHEDMFFRVLVQCLDPDTKAPMQDLSVKTNPIKVISKPEGIHKRQKKNSQGSSSQQTASTSPQVTQLPTPGSTTSTPGMPAISTPGGGLLMVPKLEPGTLPSTKALGTAALNSCGSSNGNGSGNSISTAITITTPTGVQLSGTPPRGGGGTTAESSPFPTEGVFTGRQQQQQMQMNVMPVVSAASAPLPAVSISSSNNNGGSSGGGGGGRKRTLNDMVVETITRIEKRQIEQQRLLEEMNARYVKRQCFTWGDSDCSCAQQQQSLQQQQQPGQPQPMGVVSVGGASTSSSGSESGTMIPGDGGGNGGLFGADFDVAFAVLMEAYCKLTPAERAMRVRRIIQMTTPSQVANISELVDLFASEGLGRELGRERLPTALSPPQSHGPGGPGSGYDDIISLDFPSDPSFTTAMSPPPH